MIAEIVTKRLFIGGLSCDVSKDDIIERFSRFGKVDNVKLTTRTDDKGVHVKSFVHLDLEGEEAKLKKCFDTYQNTKWKGSILKLQYAKESFLDRLKKEREEERFNKINKEDNNSPEKLDPPPRAPDISDINGPAVPGTLLPGKTNWVVGKYGRVLPLMKLKKSCKLKTIKHDPSKYCHAAKIFKEDTADSAKCEELTWEITTPDSDITKKRKGEFPPMENVKKVKVFSVTQPITAVKFNHLKNSSIKAKKEDEIEIVMPGFKRTLNQTARTEKNKFDSDIESDAESNAALVEPKKNQPKSFTGVVSVINPHNNLKSLNSNGGLNNQPGWRKIPEFQGLKMLGIHLGNSGLSPAKKSPTHFNSELSSQDQTILVTAKEAVTKINLVNDKNSIPAKKDISPTKYQEFSAPSSTCTIAELSDSIIKKLNNITDQSINSINFLQNHADNNKTAVKRKITPSTRQEQSAKSDLIKTICSTKSHHIPLLSPLNSAPLNKLLNELSHETHSNTVSSPDHFEQDRDDDTQSVSSANTDEIIACYKKKCDLSKTNISSSTEKTTYSIKNKPSRSLNMSLLDNSFYTSEYFNDSVGLSDYSLPNETIAISASDDSDLDSNDFELVAKKLEKKAALSSASVVKSTQKEKITSLNTVAISASDDSDLDSNDFELIAKKKLEKKAALSSTSVVKSTQKEKMTSLNTHDSTDVHKIPKHSEEQMFQNVNNENQCQKDKKISDNEKRLKALKETMKIKQQQKMLIQKALQNVDSKDNRQNRIIFNSDSEDESTIETPNVENIKKNAKATLNLFDSSSDSESDYEDMLKSKSHFEGKKGEKLMQMESRFGDSRFKLDAKFVDSESDSDTEDNKTSNDMSKDNVLEEEKAANLKVLENVVGKSKLDRFSEKIKRNTKHIIDMNTVRFDPTKVLPQKEVKKQNDELSQTKQVDELSNNKAVSSASDMNTVIFDPTKVLPQKEVKKQNDELSQTRQVDKLSNDKAVSSASLEPSHASGKSQVHLDKSLLNLFMKDNESNGKVFSLLEQFGNTENSSDDSSESDMEKDTKSKNILSGLFQKTKPLDIKATETKATPTEISVKASSIQNDNNQETDDESDNDVSESESLPENEGVESQLNVEPGYDKELFNAGRADIRFTKDLWLQRWEEIRPTLVKMFKKKHKEALKSKRLHGEMKRKKEFLKNAKNRQWIHRKR